jgi:S1-C subfamily serine protease
LRGERAPIGEAAADRFDLGADIGALVIEVPSASPADIAGIAQWDVTVRIDGADIMTAGYAAAAIADTLPEDVIEL